MAILRWDYKGGMEGAGKTIRGNSDNDLGERWYWFSVDLQWWHRDSKKQ